MRVCVWGGGGLNNPFLPQEAVVPLTLLEARMEMDRRLFELLPARSSSSSSDRRTASSSASHAPIGCFHSTGARDICGFVKKKKEKNKPSIKRFSA